MKRINSYLSIMVFIFICSCSQRWNSNLGRISLIKDPVATKNIKEVKSILKVKDQLSALYESPQLFTIDTQHDTILVGIHSTIIQIPSNCFVDEKGNLVTGLAKIELKELYSKKDMILSNKPTMSNGKLLESNGEIYLNATLNGKRLLIGCDEGIQVTMASPYLNDMVMWSGSINKNGDINWVEDSTILSNQQIENPETNWVNEENNYEYNTVDKYIFTTRKFGWINCDRFYEYTKEKTDMYVQIKNPFPKEYKIYVYALFTNINAVMQLYSRDGENYTLSNVPEDETIKLVSLSETETKTFFSLEEIKVIKNNKVLVELNPISKKDIQKALENL